MKKAFTTLALAALLLAGAGLAGCASKCCDGNPPCADCPAKMDCAKCEDGQACEKCAAKMKAMGCADCKDGQMCEKCAEMKGK